MHEHYIKVSTVTPAQYRNAGKDIEINYGVAESPFGTAGLATTNYGICALEFLESDNIDSFHNSIRRKWKDATFVNRDHDISIIIQKIFSTDKKESFVLTPEGSNFQIQVWRALLNIHSGQLSTYKKIAEFIGKPQASRAVAQAIASNPIAYLIPCHRVVRSDGNLSGYRWGPVRKQAMIDFEAATKTT
ncbi:MAG: methylated-DNA--[protein]-cysteine S-methyltransferase [Gammaproteobacteria bacterium]|nr:methylated-DNA--[protein]-cysteine S-methyltransferase [Gammaproteobacteria bacterium]